MTTHRGRGLVFQQRVHGISSVPSSSSFSARILRSRVVSRGRFLTRSVILSTLRTQGQGKKGGRGTCRQGVLAVFGTWVFRDEKTSRRGIVS